MITHKQTMLNKNIFIKQKTYIVRQNKLTE